MVLPAFAKVSTPPDKMGGFFHNEGGFLHLNTMFCDLFSLDTSL